MSEEHKTELCEMCEKNHANLEHPCPFSEEMGGGDTCNCCDECSAMCAMDI